MNDNYYDKTFELKDDEFISDILTKHIVADFNKNKRKAKILIHAQMGTGKTTFAFDTIIAKLVKGINEKFEEKEKRILVLSNRDALKSQIKKKYKYDEDVVEVINYQELEKRIQGNALFEKVRFVIADEIHYPFSDIAFNDTADMSLEEYLLSDERAAVFFSATPQLFAGYMDKFHWMELTKTFKITKSVTLPKLTYYWSADKQDELITNILEENKDDKILVFRNDKGWNKSDAEKYRKWGTTHISADLKNGRAGEETDYQYIVSNEQFKKKTRIVFTTSVLDNGINICDDSVRHIFIDDFLDIEGAVQCCGRRRIAEDNNLSIYVKLPTEDKILDEIKKLKRALQADDDLEQLTPHAFALKYGRNLSGLYYPYVDENDPEGKLYWKRNEVRAYKIENKLELLENMLKDSNAFMDLFKNSIGYSFEETIQLEEHVPFMQIREKILAIISSNEGRLIFSNFKSADNDGRKLLVKEINAVLPWNHKMMSYDYGNVTTTEINEILKKYRLPYYIKQDRYYKSDEHHLDYYWEIHKNV